MVAKKLNKGKKQPYRTQLAKQRVPRPVGGMAVEKAVRDYIQLLKDPCNGPLVGPVGATANGYITRFETTVSVAPNNGNWVLKWTPGALYSNATDATGLYGVDSASLTGAQVQTLQNGTGALPGAPGYAFLTGTCQTFRCLAACAQIRYTDTEVNRKGVVGSTICTGARTWSNIGQAFSITVDRARVPDQALEVLWQPGDGDETFTSMVATTPDVETLARKNAILLAGSGCLTGSVSVRLVVVYQWTPGSDDSIILPVPTPGTGITMARVVQLARQAGFVAGHLIKGYTTGGLYGVAREAASMIKPSIRSMT